MKRLSAFMGCLFISGLAFCQLSVSPSHGGTENFLYVAGNILYVQGSVHLKRNPGPDSRAGIYLRKEGQLIQGHEGPSQNSGAGFISIYQEGTSNAYDYNYWASPVGSEGSGNGLFGIGMLYAPEDILNSHRAANTGQFDGFASPLTISNRWIYTYSGKEYSDWKFVGHNTTIPAGYGFSMKGVNGTDPVMVGGRANNPGNAQRYDFRGKPNSGTIRIPVSPENATLTGNPYPSALDLSLFLLENSGTGIVLTSCYGSVQRNDVITGIAYFWDSRENGNSHYLGDYVGGYGAFSPIDPCTTGIYAPPIFMTYSRTREEKGKGEHYERRFTPVAQGFMVQGTNAANMEFGNRHRIFKKEGENSRFKAREVASAAGKNEDQGYIPLPVIRLQIDINDEYSRELSLVLWPTATTGTDPGMDAPAFNIAPTDVGWLQNNNSFAIEVRPFDREDKIPLFVKVENTAADLTFSVFDTENVEIEKIFILDEETGVYYPLNKEGLNISLDPGIYHHRFKLSFSEKTEPVLLLHENNGKFSVFQNNHMGKLEILNTSSAPIASVAIHDLQGRLIFRKDRFEDPGYVQVSTKNWGNGVYLLKISNKKNLKTTRKILVLN